MTGWRRLPTAVVGGENWYKDCCLNTTMFDSYRLSSTFKTHWFVALVIFGNFAGTVVLRAGMREGGHLPAALTLASLAPFLNPWTILGTLLMALGMLAEMALVSWADLSYVLPVTSIVYVLAAFSGWCFLHESISAAHWAGIGLISMGAGLVTRTPACRQQILAAGAGR
jgi:drug/metabolite transporter (DMT)-like permease